MTIKLVIEFSELNINVNIKKPEEDAAIVEQLETLKQQLDEKEKELLAALGQAPK